MKMSSLGLFALLFLGITQAPLYATAQCTMKPDVNKLFMKVGETVSVYCSTSEGSTVAFKKDGTSIRGTEDRLSTEGSVAARERVLRIFNVILSDAGEYTCEKPAGQEMLECGRFTLAVYDEIKFPNENDEKVQYLRQGQSGVLECTAKSASKITYEWYVGDRKITADSERDFEVNDGTLRIIAAKKLNSTKFTCRAALQDFSYFRDLVITLGLLEGEPFSCVKCRHFGSGSILGEGDNCAVADGISATEKCDSSCVTINATGPSLDGTSKYATIRGCGDKLSILKERCVTLPNSLIQLNALSVFGDASGLTNAKACFCSSGDECNNQERIYSTSGSARSSLTTGAFIGTVLYILVTIIR
ncbi:uncharacterized protein [Apostichopus japonicus]|uniref:uncharacterized protein isoform X2 n=1 Tax=Stichopus japonicus TaxID=307972 RepID=UPI003AB8C05C